MHKHVGKLLSAQRDILSPQAITAMEAAMLELKKALSAGASKKELLEEMTNLENAANTWLKPYPNAGLRENVEVLLVAIAVVGFVSSNHPTLASDLVGRFRSGQSRAENMDGMGQLLEYNGQSWG